MEKLPSDIKSEIDEHKLGMIGEFLAQEDHKHGSQEKEEITVTDK
jgi:hypothetical protein